MERHKILNITKLKCDELCVYDDGGVVTTPLLDNLINGETNRMLMFLPPHLVPVTVFYDESSSSSIPTKETNADGTGYILLPSGFLRLIYFKMEEWERPVTIPILETSPEYLAQKNIYSRGGLSTPVCAIRNTELGKILEYYSVNDSHVVEKALCVIETLPEDLEDLLIDPLTWYLCAASFQIINREALAKMAMGKVEEFIKLHS